MNEIKQNSVDKISYHGTIKVKIMNGKKVYKEKVFHNNGRWPIFNHIAYSLAGQYSNADNWRPLVLALYSIPKDYTDDGKAPQIEDNQDAWNIDPRGADDKIDWSLANKHSIKRYANSQNIRIGNAAMFMIKPEVEVNKDAGIGGSNVTYKFLIPFTQLKVVGNPGQWSADGYNIPPINLACLYSKNNLWWNWNNEKDWNKSESETYGNPDAFFFVTNSGDDKLGSLLPKSITSNVGEYSLSIEWTLKFTSNSSYVSPETKYLVTWIDKIQAPDEDPIVDECKWGTLPKCPFTFDYKSWYADKTGLKYNYAFAGFDPEITTVDKEETTYTATYWVYDHDGNKVLPHPVSDKPVN